MIAKNSLPNRSVVCAVSALLVRDGCICSVWFVRVYRGTLRMQNSFEDFREVFR